MVEGRISVDMRVGRRVNILAFLIEVDGSIVAGIIALVIFILSAVVHQIIEYDFFDVFVEGDLVLQTYDVGCLFFVIFEP